MINIKFINATSVQLLKHTGPINGGSDTIVSNVGEFTSPTEYYYSGDDFSTSDRNYYHFAITGQNVQLSGVIDSVTTKQQFTNLFYRCTQITNADQLVLSETTLTDFCYSNMFGNCSNLTTPPVLSATTLAPWCYQGMFAGCTSLTTAPALIATTLAKYCYYCMFYGCKSLVTAPNLPATTLTDWCYDSMFYNCKALTSITSDFTDWASGVNATKNWVTGIDTEGVLYNSYVDIIHGNNTIPQNWIQQIDPIVLPLTFKAKNDDTKILLSCYHISGDPNTVSLRYSKNKGTWNNYNMNNVIELSQNETVSFSGNNDHFSNSENCYYFFMTGNVQTIGNIQSLLNFSDTAPSSCFISLFKGCTSLQNPPLLPAINLNKQCYQNMFSGCTSLTAAPNLPATTLANSCYYQMFQNCSSLSTVPVNMLPATTLVDYCYLGMFRGCSNLSIAPNLPATAMISNCYGAMFAGCSNLSTAPQLRIRSWAEFACYQMFANCSNLNYIEVNFEGWGGGTGTFMASQGWVNNVASSGTFVKPSGLSKTFGINNIPSGWTVIDK